MSQDADSHGTPNSASAADGLTIRHAESGPPALPLSVSGAGGGVPAPRLRKFNGFLRLKDPVDLAGVELTAFDLNLLIPLSPQQDSAHVDRFCSDVYVRVFRAMRERVLGNVDAEVADFDDTKVSQETSRRQIRATLKTARKSRVTTLFRCYHNDAFVYVAADSYLLGPLNWLTVLVRSLVVLFFFAVGYQESPVLGLLLAAAVFVVVFTRGIRGVRMYGLDVGLRGAYPRFPLGSSFDTDDCMMFLKGVMPASVRAIRDSAADNDIDVTALEGPLANLEVGYSITNNFHSGDSYTLGANAILNVGGTMQNFVGGSGNIRTGSGS